MTFGFTGTVFSVAALGPQSPFPQNVDFGTPFSGTYTFDTAAPNAVLGDPKTGSYASSGLMTRSLGGLNLSYSGFNIAALNDYPGPLDFYSAGHFASSNSNKPTGEELSVKLA